MEYVKQRYLILHKSFCEFLAGIELVKKVHRTSGYFDAIIKGIGDEKLFDLFTDKLFLSTVSDHVRRQTQKCRD